MISADEFRTAFAGDGLATFEPRAVSALGLSQDQADWLVKVGLPTSAAPFLGFGDQRELLSLPSMAALYQERDPEIAERYRVIGSNGSGDPVVLDIAANGAVVFLNHDNDLERILINSSVTQLAECLLAFKRLIERAQAANGEDAYLDGNIPPDVLREFVDIVQACDPVAIEGGTLWGDELTNISSER